MTEGKTDNTKKNSISNKPVPPPEETTSSVNSNAAPGNNPTTEAHRVNPTENNTDRDTPKKETRTETPDTKLDPAKNKHVKQEPKEQGPEQPSGRSTDTKVNVPLRTAKKKNEDLAEKRKSGAGQKPNKQNADKVAPTKQRERTAQRDGPKHDQQKTDEVKTRTHTKVEQKERKEPDQPGVDEKGKVKTKPIPDSEEPAQTKGSQTLKEVDGTEAPPEPPPKAIWEEREPEDRSDPVDHEVYELKKLKNKWTIMAASVRGKLHAHRAIWRDDAYAYDQVDDWTIIAVSDGAGSAKLSRIGARIACDDCIKAMSVMLSGYKLNDALDDETPSNPDLRRLHSFLTLGACAARDGIIREAHKRQISDKDLYTTMLLLIHTTWKDKDVIGALQVGDGAIGVYTKDDTCTVMGIADHGEYSSETVFLTSWKQLTEKPYDQRILFTIKQDVRCIAVMCDGVSDDFFPEEKRLIELFIGNPVREIETRDGEPVKGVMHQVVKEPREGEALKDWLRYEKRGSSDDRTLVLFYRE
jgi:hypothetical protein